MSKSYLAINESPRVICAYGKTESKVFKEMSKAIAQLKFIEEYVLSIDTSYDEDGFFHLSVVVSGRCI
jgi:hypothetical protein